MKFNTHKQAQLRGINSTMSLLVIIKSFKLILSFTKLVTITIRSQFSSEENFKYFNEISYSDFYIQLVSSFPSFNDKKLISNF
jgi:hypothetical protein